MKQTAFQNWVHRKKCELVKNIPRSIESRYHYLGIFSPKSKKAKAKELAMLIRQLSFLFALDPKAHLSIEFKDELPFRLRLIIEEIILYEAMVDVKESK